MSYAIFIASAVGKLPSNYQKQVIIAHHNDKNYLWNRTTNGGRGEANSWQPSANFDFNTLRNASNDFVIGEVLSTKLTEVDKNAINAGEFPQVLIQKLSKQFKNRHQNISTNKTMADVLNDVEQIINTNPSLLENYISDNRGVRTSTKNEKPVEVPTKPKFDSSVIKIVQGKYSDNALSFVPNAENPEIKNYVKRTFNGVSETEIYKHALANGLNVAIVGEAGVGKTTSGMVFASEMGMNYYRVNFNAGVESSQVFGKLKMNQDGKLVWQDGGFTECWRNGNAVIQLDELSFINAKQSGMLFPCLDNQRVLILLDNEGEVIPAGENLLIIGSYNENYKGNNKLNEAFKDRFHHKLVFEYDTNIESKFIRSKTLLNLAQQLRADSIQGLYETPISTRLLKNFQRFATEISYDYAVENLLNSFTSDERASVKLLLDAHRENLESEIVS